MTPEKEKKAALVVISGPSGVGKSTICKEVVKRLGAFMSVSATTRAKSPNEVDGVDYYFLEKDEFEKKIKDSNFLEYAEVFGNYYGTFRKPVEQALRQGKCVILEIDVQGALQVKKVFADVLLIFILPPTQSELAERISHRGRDSEEATGERLQGAGTEIAAAWRYYEHMVINEDLEQAISEVMQIINGHSIGESQ
ncbi:MAG: guanylate kinase [Planctomycetota bacterium]